MDHTVQSVVTSAELVFKTVRRCQTVSALDQSGDGFIVGWVGLKGDKMAILCNIC